MPHTTEQEMMTARAGEIRDVPIGTFWVVAALMLVATALLLVGLI